MSSLDQSLGPIRTVSVGFRVAIFSLDDAPIQIKYLCRPKLSVEFWRSTGKSSHQWGDWRQVDKAEPMPVPVHIRTPRLYSVEVFETPAN